MDGVPENRIEQSDIGTDNCDEGHDGPDTGSVVRTGPCSFQVGDMLTSFELFAYIAEASEHLQLEKNVFRAGGSSKYCRHQACCYEYSAES